MSALVDLFALAAALVVVALIVAFTLITGAPPTPTSPRVRSAMMALLPAAVSGTIHEMGAGFGTLALALAARFPENAVIGHEISPVPWAVSRLLLAFRPRPNLRLRLADFRRAPLADAGLVVCYLHPRGMARLRAKLEAELAPGALVVTHTFAIPGWAPAAEATAGDLYRSRVYLYRR